MQNVQILYKKNEEMRPFGKPRHRWNNIKMDFTEIEWKGADRICRVQDTDQCQALDDTITNCYVP
jgi:hypothetical protein